jgi:hypothetical protein
MSNDARDDVVAAEEILTLAQRYAVANLDALDFGTTSMKAV